MASRYYSADDVEFLYSDTHYMRILGALSRVAYGFFISDDMRLDEDRIRIRNNTYKLFVCPQACIHARLELTRHSLSVMSFTFVLREDGSCVVIDGLVSSFWFKEHAFLHNVGAFWSADEVNSAMLDVCSTLFSVKNQCLSCSLAILRNLVVFRHVGFDCYANRVSPSWTYEYLSMFGQDIFSKASHVLFTEFCEKLVPSRLIELVDTGAAICVVLNIGAKVPRPDGSFEIMDKLHSVILLRLDDGDLSMIDQHGALRIKDTDVFGLCESITQESYISYYGGCVIFGVRKDGYMFSVDELMSIVIDCDDEQFVDMQGERVLSWDDVFDVSKVDGSSVEKFDVTSLDFRSDFMSFCVDNQDVMYSDGVLTHAESDDIERNVEFVHADVSIEKEFLRKPRDLSPVGGSFEVHCCDNDYGISVV